MNTVRAKKYLGQHFLKDENIALKIVESIDPHSKNILEIGPGMGVLTKYLIQNLNFNFKVIEIDKESVEYLFNKFPKLQNHIIEGDFLTLDLSTVFGEKFNIIGNFPYNISSQILFRVFENRNLIPEVVGMFQKEVAERIAAKPGKKTYGILSVLLSAFYDIEYLFTVDEHVFNPPPKVKSGVIRLKRNEKIALECDETFFVSVVKTAFNQRRKTLHNALKALHSSLQIDNKELLNLRAEQLSVSQFIILTNQIAALKQNDK